MKCVILSASTGNGHMSAAYAVEAALKDRGCEASTYDSLQFAPTAFRLWYGSGYEFIVRTRPELYGHLYKISDVLKGPYKIQTRNDFRFQARLKKLIAEQRPDWVVCTHSLPQPRLAQLREEFGFFKIAVVVTDLYPHLMWLRGAPDRYFVPTEWTRDILIERRRHLADRITVTGIPVHPVFSQTYVESEVREELGCSAGIPVVTITSGGIGGGPFEEAVKAIIGLDRPMHLEVICGRNERRKQKMETLAAQLKGSPVHLAIRGHISQEQMAKRMAVSTVLVSKPGGLTTSECLAMGCAMLVYHPFLIPGQEEGNADFLVSSGAGCQASGPATLRTELTAALDNPAMVSKMREIARGFGKPNAAWDIADELIRLG